jgi:hypothetical protein
MKIKESTIESVEQPKNGIELKKNKAPSTPVYGLLFSP